MLGYIMFNAIMLGNAIKMTEKLKPFMPKKQEKATKMLVHGNWERRVIPVPGNEKQGDEDSRY